MTRAEIIARLETVSLSLERIHCISTTERDKLNGLIAGLDGLIDVLLAEERDALRPIPRMMTEADLDDAMHLGIPGIMELIRSKEGKP